VLRGEHDARCSFAELSPKPVLASNHLSGYGHAGHRTAGPDRDLRLAVPRHYFDLNIALLPQSWHRQIAISRFGANPTQNTARPPEFTRACETSRDAWQASLRSGEKSALSGQFELAYGGSDARSGSGNLRQ